MSQSRKEPQGDRSKTRSEGGNTDLTVSVCDEDSEGITLRGAKMLGTGAVLSDVASQASVLRISGTLARDAMPRDRS